VAGAPPVKARFRPFPGPPPYQRIPRDWNERTGKQWAESVLRILEQQVNPLATAVHSTAAAYTVEVTTADTMVIASGGPYTVTLPPVAANVNNVVTVKNTGAAVITLSGGGANIDGAATQAVNSMNALKVVSDGTDWWIV
jgi:hypothetical protein